MSGEKWIYRHDDSQTIDELPEWVGVPPRQYLDDFLSLGRDVAEYTQREYIYPQSDASLLDYVSTEGTCGLFSQRFVSIITPYLQPSFSLLPATLDGHPFFFLRREGSVDCLDVAQSTVRYFDDDNPAKLMSITSFSFLTEKLNRPLVFGLPGYFGRIFWTKPIVDICLEARLNGIRFISIDRINKNGGHLPPVWQPDNAGDE